MGLDGDDRELMVKGIQGDRQAWAALHREWAKTLIGYVSKFGIDYNTACDIVQDVFVKVIQKAEKFDASRPVGPWLLGIARNLSINHIRRSPRRREVPQMDGVDPIDNEPSPVDIIIDNETITSMSVCIDTLPDEEREAVVLFYWTGLKYKEIAEIQGCPVATVGTRLLSARSRLGRCLQAAGLLEDGRGSNEH